MIKKIICIFNSSHDSHCRHRVEDLREAGFAVEVYCHPRNGLTGPTEAEYPLYFLSDLTAERYAGRLMTYARELRAILRANRGEDCLYFLYGLDLALVFRLQAPCTPYIYEEADLMHLEAGLQRLRWLPALLEWLDRRLIRRARLTLTTSEGFIRYHFPKRPPQNICLTLNKADRQLLATEPAERRTDMEHLQLAFIGMLRYDTLYRFARVIGQRFPEHTFHFYGPETPAFEPLKAYPNILFHGPYRNPDDLPAIYGATDIVVATYDTAQPNVRYLDPNKLYEAVAMRTPLVVSQGTFLAERVAALGAGWAVNAGSDEEIAGFIQGLTARDMAICRQRLQAIPRTWAIADNQELLQRLRAL